MRSASRLPAVRSSQLLDHSGGHRAAQLTTSGLRPLRRSCRQASISATRSITTSRMTSSASGLSTVNRIVPLTASYPESRSRTLIDDLRTEGEDAQVALRGRETEQGFPLVLQRRHPVAGALLGIGHDIQRQAPDAFECRSGVAVQIVEVVVNCPHTANDRAAQYARQYFACQMGHGRLSRVPEVDAAGFDGAGSLMGPVLDGAGLTGPSLGPRHARQATRRRRRHVRPRGCRATTWPMTCSHLARIGPGVRQCGGGRGAASPVS